jgi:hypothetical protein
MIFVIMLYNSFIMVVYWGLFLIFYADDHNVQQAFWYCIVELIRLLFVCQ